MKHGSAEVAFSERQAMTERLSSARDRGETLSIDIAQDPHNLAMFIRYAEEYGGDSAAAHTLMAAELARQALRPTRSLSDGMAMPTSFGDVRRHYDQVRNDAALVDDVGSTRRSNDGRVSSARSGPSELPANVAPPSAVRAEVQATRAQLQARTKDDAGNFDAKAEIVTKPDGTLESKKSLLLQTGKQVSGDAGATLENAKDAVKRIIKRDR